MDAVDRIFNLVDAAYKEQRDFAYDLGVTASIVSQWRCRKSASYVKHISKIAKLLDTSAEYLLTGNTPQEWQKVEEAAATRDDGFEEHVAKLIGELPPEDKVEIIADVLKRHDRAKRRGNLASPGPGGLPEE